MSLVVSLLECCGEPDEVFWPFRWILVPFSQVESCGETGSQSMCAKRFLEIYASLKRCVSLIMIS